METTVEDAHADVVSPEHVVDVLFACRKTAAIRAAIELDLFTHTGDGKTATVSCRTKMVFRRLFLGDACQYAGGQAYSQTELTEMARLAGLTGVTVKPMPPTPASLILFE